PRRGRWRAPRARMGADATTVRFRGSGPRRDRSRRPRAPASPRQPRSPRPRRAPESSRRSPSSRCGAADYDDAQALTFALACAIANLLPQTPPPPAPLRADASALERKSEVLLAGSRCGRLGKGDVGKDEAVAFHPLPYPDRDGRGEHGAGVRERVELP